MPSRYSCPIIRFGCSNAAAMEIIGELPEAEVVAVAKCRASVRAYRAAVFAIVQGLHWIDDADTGPKTCADPDCSHAQGLGPRLGLSEWGRAVDCFSCFTRASLA